MSWNGQTPVQANWSGVPQTSGDETLYTTPVPSTTAVNPKIGIVDGNEIDLPTSYNELNTANLNTTTINGNPIPISAENWSLYKAIHDVEGQRSEPPFNLRQYSIKDFIEIDAGDIYAKRELLPVPTGGGMYADVSVNAPLGSFNNVVANGSLYVSGGTTLDGGLINGTSIGSLPVEGINTVRIDVLPIGIDIISPTYITIDTLANANMLAGGAVEITAGGAISVAAGGAVSIAGGSYIEYNTDQNYFRNTTSGNDYTDIYVGNIHPADGGTDNLRINGGGSGRYVRVDDGLMIQSKAHKASQFDYLVGNHYDVDAVYVVDDEVDYQARSYKCLLENRGFLPTDILFTPWDDTTPYVVGNLVQQLLIIYRCIADITGGDLPVGNPTNWLEVGTILTPVWEFIENFEDNQYSFKSDADTYGWSLIKKKSEEGIRIMRNNVATTDFTIGRLYDDTFYRPTTSVLVVDSDVNMNLYSLLNAQKIQPSQLDVEIDWADNQLYNIGDTIIAGTNKVYRCLSQNLNLYPLSAIQYWGFIGQVYTEGNITTIGGGYNYICILGYTTATGDPSPNSDPTHWAITTGGDTTNFWELQRDALSGGVEFPALPYDASYFSLVKPAGSVYTSLWITERNAGTNELTNAGMIYDTGINVPVIGGATSLSVLGDLDMINYNVSNVGTLTTENIGGVATGSGLINVLDQLQGTGKSIQNFNYLNLISPATGDNATIDLRTTANDIGLRLTIDADTGEGTISANLGLPLTITTNNKLYLNGDTGIMANTLSMSGDIEMGSNDINNCDNLTTNAINTIGNLFRRGNFASIVDQTFTAGSTAEQQIQMTETLGTTNGISLNSSTFEISVDTDGSYKVDMTYQLNSSGGSHTHTYLWIKNNGTAIPVSTQQTTIRNNEVQCVSYNRIFQLESGDKLTFWWNSSNANDYLYNNAGLSTPYVRPRQPSVAISVVSC